MKKSLRSQIAVLLCGLLFGGAVSQALAEQPAIYVVDMQRVVSESIAGKAARNNLESEIKKRQGKFEEQKIELKSLQGELDKQSAVLSASAMAGRRDEMMRKERQLMREIQDEQADIGRKHDLEVAKIVKEVDSILAELAKEEGYEFIVERDKRFVIYVNQDFDLTDKVIEELDDRKVGG